ncbi:hypothetical protein ABH994_001442 [Bradyrhizobium yuanmingense]|uniref:hypothetical protein n=1 Tax=Bradyrhizobium yuanmingense TaxID=108015 RepID=UPI003519771C
MNHSIYTADRTTHLKVVVAAVMAGIAIVMTALTIQLNRPGIDVQKSTNLASSPNPRYDPSGTTLIEA